MCGGVRGSGTGKKKVVHCHTSRVVVSASVVESLQYARPPLEFVFQEQSYPSLHSGRSLAWGHICGDIDDPCGVITDF